MMTISKRTPAATPAKVPAAKKPAAKKPAAKLPRRTTLAAASKTVKPAVPPAPAPAKAAKTPPTPRNNEKRIRCSFALPESQIALLDELKRRCLGFGVSVKKGDLLTAGLQLLKNFPETALEQAVLPSMRSGRRLETGKKRKK